MQVASGYTFGPTSARLAGMTIVADTGPTPITSPGVAPETKKHRNVRIEGLIWFAASRAAEINGERISNVVRDLLSAYVQRNKKALDADPKWQTRLAHFRATGEWEMER